MNIYLIGYRGTGKSSVAPLLAQRLGPSWSWVDLDAQLEQRAGRTIAQIFAEDGEQTFRDLESQELSIAAGCNETVVATGGGVIGREENRQLLRAGWVVWLTAAPEVIFRRVSGDTTTNSRRPNLTTGGLEEIQELLARRTPIYQSLANLSVATDHASIEHIVEQILNHWRLERPSAVGSSSSEAPQ